VRIYINIDADTADKLIAMAVQEKRTTSAQASWLLEQLLAGNLTSQEPSNGTNLQTV
jgi:hypothetical protein